MKIATILTSTLLVSLAAAGPIERRGRSGGGGGGGRSGSSPSGGSSGFGSGGSSGRSGGSGSTYRSGGGSGSGSGFGSAGSGSGSGSGSRSRGYAKPSPSSLDTKSPRKNDVQRTKLRTTGLQRTGTGSPPPPRKPNSNSRASGAGYSVNKLGSDRSKPEQQQEQQQRPPRGQSWGRAATSGRVPTERVRVIYVNGVPQYVPFYVGVQTEYDDDNENVGQYLESGTPVRGSFAEDQVIPKGGSIRQMRTGSAKPFAIVDGTSECGDLNLYKDGLFARVPKSMLGEPINAGAPTKLKFANCGKRVDIWYENMYTPAWIVGAHLDQEMGESDVELSFAALLALGNEPVATKIHGGARDVQWIMN